MIKFVFLLLITLCSSFSKAQSFAFKTDGGSFDLNIHCIMSNDTVVSKKYIDSILNYTVEVGFDCRAATYYNYGYPIVVWMPKVPRTFADLVVLNHELMHVVIGVMEWAGVKLCEDTEEVYAYEMSYISKKFFKEIEKIKQK